MKGCTLIELLAIIIIIGLVFTVVYVNVNDTKDLAREKIYESQVNNIIAAAKNWQIDHIGVLPENASEVYKLSLEDLKRSGNITKEDITNSVTGDIMNGCIIISCSNENCKQYNYEYIESNCDGV